MKKNHLSNLLLLVLLVWILAAGFGCAQARRAVPAGQAFEAQLSGMPDVRRQWLIDYNPDIQQSITDSSGCNFLALSGGGANGAFGAGFLCGWTKTGTRPEFQIVTGISTGALTAPFAFLGSEYDDELEEAYTTIERKDIFIVRGIFGILGFFLGESFAKTEPLAELIEKLVTEEELATIASEHAKGRRLYIGTANLDAQRFVIWDMGAIASSEHPQSLTIFRKVMLASASIPGAFPPVYFDVELNSEKYDEMHVDGGVMAEVFGYGPSLFSADETLEWAQNKHCSIYVIRNGKLEAEHEEIPRNSLKIIDRSFSSLMKSHCWGDLYRIYSLAQKDDVDFNYVDIPKDYSISDKIFNRQEMKKLFDLGYKMAESGYEWRKTIPDI